MLYVLVSCFSMLLFLWFEQHRISQCCYFIRFSNIIFFVFPNIVISFVLASLFCSSLFCSLFCCYSLGFSNIVFQNVVISLTLATYFSKCCSFIGPSKKNTKKQFLKSRLINHFFRISEFRCSRPPVD